MCHILYFLEQNLKLELVLALSIFGIVFLIKQLRTL